MSQTNSSTKLRMMIVTALFAAIIAVLAQVAIPMPLGVPITGQTLAIGLAATILGSRYGTLSAIRDLIIGAISVPGVAQFTGGLGILLGPAGCFLIGFIPTTLLMGCYLEKTSFTLKNALIADIIGMFITLIFGTIWLKFICELPWSVAIAGGFTPFLIGGFIKAFIVAYAGIIVRDRLKSAELLPAT